MFGPKTSVNVTLIIVLILFVTLVSLNILGYMDKLPQILASEIFYIILNGLGVLMSMISMWTVGRLNVYETDEM